MNSEYFTVSHLMSPHEHLVFLNSKATLALRTHLNGHRAVNLWFTGLSGSVKFMLSHSVEERLHSMWCRKFVLDGGMPCVVFAVTWASVSRIGLKTLPDR